MNAHEINIALRGLQCLESELCAQWEKAQKAHPCGVTAIWFVNQLRGVRLLADKLSETHKTDGAAIAAATGEARPMVYRLSTFGADRTGFWVIESRHGIAAKGEPSTVHRVKVFTEQPARDAYMAQRGYI